MKKLLLTVALLIALPAHAQDAKRGQYIAQLGGCVGCHTEKEGATPFAGGRALKTPFGTFYGPNITPHKEAGIGSWTQAQFVRAMRYGERPDGSHYFPAFPYTSFTRIGDKDLADLFAYLKSLPPNARANTAHDLKFPFGYRFAVAGWKMLFFKPGVFESDPKASAQVNLGGYLANALGHCGECHTARNALGGLKTERHFAGGKTPEDKDVSNLTPASLKRYGDDALKNLLTTGLTEDGDVLNETMGEVVTNTLSKMSPVDLDALVAYLRSLPPIADEAKKK
jgi:mono/diheme cytochrome c family protein